MGPTLGRLGLESGTLGLTPERGGLALDRERLGLEHGGLGHVARALVPGECISDTMVEDSGTKHYLVRIKYIVLLLKKAYRRKMSSTICAPRPVAPSPPRRSSDSVATHSSPREQTHYVSRLPSFFMPITHAKPFCLCLHFFPILRDFERHQPCALLRSEFTRGFFR